MKIRGRSQFVTFARYVNPDAEMVANIAEALAELNSKAYMQNSSEMVLEVTQLKENVVEKGHESAQML